jgi:hypothetical protein
VLSIRNAIVLVVLLTVSAAPALLEYCATSCETHKTAHSSSQPACHHSATSSSDIAPPAVPCGHDHAGFVAAFSANGVAPVPHMQPVVMSGAHVPVSFLPHDVSGHAVAATPGPPLDESVRPLPLRV